MYNCALSNIFKARFGVEVYQLLVGYQEDPAVRCTLLRRFLETRHVLFQDPERDALPSVLGTDTDGVDADGRGAGYVCAHGAVCEHLVRREGRASESDESAGTIGVGGVGTEKEIGCLRLTIP